MTVWNIFIGTLQVAVWVDPDDYPEKMITDFAIDHFGRQSCQDLSSEKVTARKQEPTKIQGRLHDGSVFDRNILQLERVMP